jgi:hypothetical protein
MLNSILKYLTLINYKHQYNLGLLKRFIINKHLVLSVLLVLGSVNCKDANPNAEYEQKVAQIQAVYQSQIKETYQIDGSFKSREEAVLSFIKDVSRGILDSPFLCSEQETKEILLPNTYNTGTITSMQEPEEAWNLMKMRRHYGLENLRRSLEGKKILDIQYKWKKARELNSLLGHSPKLIIQTDKGSFESEEIRLVIEHKGQFKVCIVSK